jgi:hypothetical protein
MRMTWNSVRENSDLPLLQAAASRNTVDTWARSAAPPEHLPHPARRPVFGSAPSFPTISRRQFNN